MKKDILVEKIERETDGTTKLLEITHSHYVLNPVIATDWKGLFKALEKRIEESKPIVDINKVIRIELTPEKVELHTIALFRVEKENGKIKSVKRIV